VTERPDREPVLETAELSVRFGGLHAVGGVDLQVRPGEIVGLIGPNGAGKTTFVDALTGFVRSTGSVQFAGRDVTGWPAHRLAQAGLVRTWQSIELFTDLTVAENLLVGSNPRGVDVEGALARLGLDGLAPRLPSEVSHGQQKLVGVARAIARAPRLVLMDEPAAGLDVNESRELGERLRGLVHDDTAILLIDHDMGLVLSVCDYVYVLESGRLIAQGPPTEIRRDPRVLAAYLGEDVGEGAGEGAGEDAGEGVGEGTAATAAS
jgi:branched-chain amino acid transport system ATP-binding protein